MKRKLLFICLSLLSLSAFTQNIAIESFVHDVSDLTANTQGTIVYDDNGDKCALIKVRCNPPTLDFLFDVGQLGIKETRVVGAEIWLYVPYGVKSISIQHPKLGFLSDYDLGMSVKKASTYILSLRAGRVQTIIEDEVRQQYLVFMVDTKDAMVEVNGEVWNMTDGACSKMLPFGTYEYRVSCRDYHDEVGKVTLNNADETKTIPVKMRPAFGWLEVKDDAVLNGASVYVDDKLIGKAPIKTDRLASGQHSVRIVKDMYKTYSQNVVITDSEIFTIAPLLKANFAEVVLETMEGAEILINGQTKGITRWSGRLAYGDYSIETRKASHRSQRKNYKIIEGMTTKTFDLPDPIPVYGTLLVDVAPMGGIVYVDGDSVGITPKQVSKILIGEHKIEVKKQGKAPLRQTIMIEEGKTTRVSGILENGMMKVTFKNSDKDLNVVIDGVAYTLGDYGMMGEFSLGMHKIELSKANHYPKSIDCEITMDGQVIELPELVPIMGTLIVKSNPTSSRVYVDGEYRGMTPLTLQVPIGEHKVYATKDGYNISDIEKVAVSTRSEGTTINMTLKKVYSAPSKSYSSGKSYSSRSSYSKKSYSKPTRTRRVSTFDYSDVLSDYYDNAGSVSAMVYRVAGGLGSYWDLEFAMFTIRYKMIELDWLNFAYFGDYQGYELMSYDPTLRFILPVSGRWAIYTGVAPVIVFGAATPDTEFFTFSPECYFKADLGVRFKPANASVFDFFARYNYAAGFTVGLAWHIGTSN